MRIAYLSPATLAAIKKMRYDSIVEKHEGPEIWKYYLDSQYPEQQEYYAELKSMGSDIESSGDAELIVGKNESCASLSPHQLIVSLEVRLSIKRSDADVLQR